ncbi:unnamed protein product, partial [Mesorhabditis spiculigera]
MVIYIAQIYAAANRLTSAIFPLSYEHLWTKWRMVIMTLIQIIIPLIIVIPVNFDPSYDIRYAIDSGKIRLFTDAQSTFLVALIDGASSVISTTLSMVCYVITCIGTYRRAHLAAEIRLLASSLLVFGILAFNSLFQVGTILATYCGVREMYMLQDLSYPIVDAIYSCQPWAILISSSIVRQTFFRHLRRKQNKNDITNFSVLMISKVKSTEAWGYAVIPHVPTVCGLSNGGDRLASDKRRTISTPSSSHDDGNDAPKICRTHEAFLRRGLDAWKWRSTSCNLSRCTDIFVYAAKDFSPVIQPGGLRVTSCLPLFEAIMNSCAAGCVIHSHSLHSNLLTQIAKVAGQDYVCFTDQEYLKGIRSSELQRCYANTDQLKIPIISNKPTEEQLLPELKLTLQKSGAAIPAVLVQNHGLFVWGRTWQEAKIHAECLEYLFELAIEASKAGIKIY